MVFMRNTQVPLLKQARDQSIGARREYYEMLKNCEMIDCATFASCHQTQKNAHFAKAFTEEEWGKGDLLLVKALQSHSFQRHHFVAKKAGITYK